VTLPWQVLPNNQTATATVTVAPAPGTTATITSPSNGASFAEGVTIALTGSGTDPQGGDLTGSALAWTSGIDGQIGTGTSFTRDDLSVGTHIITLTATGGEGGTGTASVTVTVYGPGSIVPGDWQTTVAFGTVDFTVNAQSTAVTYVRFNFAGYTCGTVTVSGWLGFGGTRPITNNEFGMDETDPDGNRFVFGGTFDQSGTQASGTWLLTVLGNTCTGTWQGTPL
jgi:hypothetical protein